MHRGRSNYDRKFARITRRLRDYPRGRSSHTGEWDLLGDLTSGSSSDLFLGVYGDLAIMDLLGEFGLLDALAEQGIHHPCLELELGDAYRHIMRIYDGDIEPGKLVAELVFRRTHLSSRSLIGAGEQALHPCLYLEWILLQNPHRRFDRGHPSLPGQALPGLGIGAMALSLIASMARNLHLSGIITVPANLHSALFFLKSYSALTPRVQAELQALKRTARKYGRLELVWAEHWGDLLERETGRTYHWHPSDVARPVADELQTWFEGNDDYRREVERYRPRFVVREGVVLKRFPDGKIARDIQEASA